MRIARARGFTIIEIVIAIAVMALLMFMAVPSFARFLQNQQVRIAADAILNGAQVARGEAIRRNLSVQLAIGVPQTGWTISESVSGAVIQTRAHEEGSSNANVATTPGGATTITFTPLGGVTATNADGSVRVERIDINHLTGGACQTPANAAGVRCLRVLITGGGSVRLCDPAFPVAVPPNPRACP
jgi:type IV fimbrial biogenesis protein FimT